MKSIGLIIDIVFALVAIVIVVISTRRGFARAAIRILSFVVAMVVASTFSATVASFLSEKWLDERVDNFVYTQIASLSQKEGGESFDLGRLFEGKQVDFVDLVRRFDADMDTLEDDYGSITDGTEDTVRELSKRISTPLSAILAKAISYAALFFATMLAMALLGLLVGVIARLPVLKTLDSLLGFVCGLVLAVAFLFVFSTVGKYLAVQLHAIYPNVIPSTVVEDSFALSHFSSIAQIKELFLGA